MQTFLQCRNKEQGCFLVSPGQINKIKIPGNSEKQGESYGDNGTVRFVADTMLKIEIQGEMQLLRNDEDFLQNAGFLGVTKMYQVIKWIPGDFGYPQEPVGNIRRQDY